MDIFILDIRYVICHKLLKKSTKENYIESGLLRKYETISAHDSHS